MLVLPVMAVGIGMLAALAGLAVVAGALLAAAVGISIWLWRQRDARRAAGKSNTGWVVFLVLAYITSVPYLVFFILILVSTFTGEAVTLG